MSQKVIFSEMRCFTYFNSFKDADDDRNYKSYKRTRGYVSRLDVMKRERERKQKAKEEYYSEENNEEEEYYYDDEYDDLDEKQNEVSDYEKHRQKAKGRGNVMVLALLHIYYTNLC